MLRNLDSAQNVDTDPGKDVDYPKPIFLPFMLL